MYDYSMMIFMFGQVPNKRFEPNKFKGCVGQLGYSRKMRWRSDIPLVLKRKKKEWTKGKNNL